MPTIREALQKANAKLHPKVNDALAKEVFEAVKDEESSAIYETVYKVYTPKMYQRRFDRGGMADPENIKGVVKDGKLHVVNVTQPNDVKPSYSINKNLPELIEYGDGYKGYHYDFGGGVYTIPRPFTKKTIEHLQENKTHVDALRSGLKRRGVRFK